MTKQQGWSLARLRGAIYAVAMMVGFLAPVQPATYTGPRTLWVWLGVWQSTMGITSTTGIVLVTWLAVLLTVLGALLRLWAAMRRMPRARAVGSALMGLAVCILMPPFGALVAAPILIAFEVVVISAARLDASSAGGQSANERSGLRALAQEAGVLAAAACFAALSWQYNARLLEQALLIACGAGLIARAALPGKAAAGENSQA